MLIPPLLNAARVKQKGGSDERLRGFQLLSANRKEGEDFSAFLEALVRTRLGGKLPAGSFLKRILREKCGVVSEVLPLFFDRF